MQEIRADYRPIYVLLATLVECPTCGFDEFSQGGFDTNCATCNGTGRSVEYTRHEMKGRIKILDFVQLQGAGYAPPGVELGDVEVYVRPHDRDVFEECEKDTRSYIVISGDAASYRPFSINADGVGYEDEVRVLLKKANVESRATGL